MATDIQQHPETDGAVEESPNVLNTTCCIVGCGPAGAMLGLLLARTGVEVLVLEKHSDFLRDFRGDTIHPSTLEIMDELGLADELLQLPHTKVPVLQARTPRGAVTLADFRRLKTRYPYIAFMPQWDFLNFIATEAKRYPTFQLVMNAEARALVEEDGVVRGVRYRADDGWHDVRALLTVAADGRTSVLRDQAGFEIASASPPMDVFWFRLSRREDDPDTFGWVGGGHILAFINRSDYWQVAYTIPKGAHKQVRSAGLEAFKDSMRALVPEMADRVEEVQDWEQVKLLVVQSNRLKRWYRPGLLCIGDAAHAMSPIGGVGINLAIQDAVAAANVLAEPLREGRVELRHLWAVQRRREWPTRIIQGIQSLIQRRVTAPALASPGLPSFPRPVRALFRLNALRNLPPRLIAFGVWPVHVER